MLGEYYVCGGGFLRPKVGLALSAGSARGLAHIGALQVFIENNIPIDMIAGTSAGAIVGSLYAAGTDMYLLERMAQELNWNKLVNLTVPKLGLVSSERVHELVKVLTRNLNFEDLPIPAAVVATDIQTGEEVVIKTGNVADGVRASMSIPGIFVPVELGGRLLVDGALVNRVPGRTVRELGADIVIAVDVGLPPVGKKVTNLGNIIMRTIEILDRENAKFRPIDADVIVRPDLSNVTSTQLNRAAEIIAAGRTAAEASLKDIQDVLAGTNLQAK